MSTIKWINIKTLFQVSTGEVITLATRHGSNSYFASDVLHWMASYGTCPETGVIHSPLQHGNGHTRMNINLF